MPYSQKYTIVSFLYPLNTGVEFSMADWPLHVTLADVFAVSLSDSLVHELADLLMAQPVVTATANKETMLGDARVMLLEKSQPLIDFHLKLINLLESRGAVFNSPEHTREGFVPHCTNQKTEKLQGETFVITTVSLVDMFTSGDWRQRKVLHTFNMRPSTD